MTVTDPGPPRRRAARSRRPAVNRTGVGAAVLLVLVAALAVLATETARPSAEPSRQAATEQVTRSLFACPAKATARGASTTLVAGSAPSSGLGDAGSVRRGAPGGPWQEAGLARGRLVDLGAQGRDSMAVDGRGELAAGLFGFRGDTGPGTSAFASCSAPRADWWFTGTGATIDHSSELVMTNLDPGPAVVDLRLFSPDGVPDAVGTRGIIVPPGESVAMPMADVVPQSDELAVNVRASRGRVVAAVSDSFIGEQGGRPGHEWLPDQTGPMRVVRVAGLPQRPDRVTLVVANPSSLEAVVDVSVAGEAGSFRPVGLDQLQISPGTVKTVDVTQALGKDPSALRLRSQVPIVASARSTAGGDSSYGAAVSPLSGPAAAPVAPRGASNVLLTASSAAARARVTSYDAKGNRTGQTELDLPPGATRAWSAAKGDYLVVTPLQGAVSGAVSYGGAGLASFPLATLPIEVRRPAVVPALS